jgi:arylsulfatase A-like enzyme
MVRTPEWKYVFVCSDNERLFDMEADPWELTDRSKDPACAKTLAAMRYRLIDSMRRCIAPWEPPRAEKK